MKFSHANKYTLFPCCCQIIFLLFLFLPFDLYSAQVSCNAGFDCYQTQSEAQDVANARMASCQTNTSNIIVFGATSSCWCLNVQSSCDVSNAPNPNPEFCFQSKLNADAVLDDISLDCQMRGGSFSGAVGSHSGYWCVQGGYCSLCKNTIQMAAAYCCRSDVMKEPLISGNLCRAPSISELPNIGVTFAIPLVGMAQCSNLPAGSGAGFCNNNGNVCVALDGDELEACLCNDGQVEYCEDGGGGASSSSGGASSSSSSSMSDDAWCRPLYADYANLSDSLRRACTSSGGIDNYGYRYNPGVGPCVTGTCDFPSSSSSPFADEDCYWQWELNEKFYEFYVRVQDLTRACEDAGGVSTYALAYDLVLGVGARTCIAGSCDNLGSGTTECRTQSSWLTPQMASLIQDCSAVGGTHNYNIEYVESLNKFCLTGDCIVPSSSSGVSSDGGGGSSSSKDFNEILLDSPFAFQCEDGIYCDCKYLCGTAASDRYFAGSDATCPPTVNEGSTIASRLVSSEYNVLWDALFCRWHIIMFNPDALYNCVLRLNLSIPLEECYAFFGLKPDGSSSDSSVDSSSGSSSGSSANSSSASGDGGGSSSGSGEIQDVYEYCHANPRDDFCIGIADLCKRTPNHAYCKPGTNFGGVPGGSSPSGGAGGDPNGNDTAGNGISCKSLKNCDWSTFDEQLKQTGIFGRILDSLRGLFEWLKYKGHEDSLLASLKWDRELVDRSKMIQLSETLNGLVFTSWVESQKGMRRSDSIANYRGAAIVDAIDRLRDSLSRSNSASSNEFGSFLTSWQDMLSNYYANNPGGGGGGNVNVDMSGVESALTGVGRGLDSIGGGFGKMGNMLGKLDSTLAAGNGNILGALDSLSGGSCSSPECGDGNYAGVGDGAFAGLDTSGISRSRYDSLLSVGGAGGLRDSADAFSSRLRAATATPFTDNMACPAAALSIDPCIDYFGESCKRSLCDDMFKINGKHFLEWIGVFIEFIAWVIFFVRIA